MCAVTIVTAVLAVSAFAGTLDSPGVVTPPPPPGIIDSPGVAGIIDSPGVVAPSPSETTLTSTTTTIILAILNLIR
jgi:hypothetical protein